MYRILFAYFVCCFVLACDNSDNSNSSNNDEANANTDTTKPVITWSPATLQMVIDSTATVNVTATDNIDGTIAIASNQVNCNHGQYNNAIYTAPSTVVNTQCSVIVSDAAGNQAEAILNIQVVANSSEVVAIPLPYQAAWLLNQTDMRSTQIFESNGSLGVLYDVETVSTNQVGNQLYTYVEASGIPQYDITLTQSIFEQLNARPKANSDFAGGQTSATVGDVIVFGQNIGYNSSNQNCPTTGGEGYWPPGPVCPTNQNHAIYITHEPTPNTTDCETGLGMVGILLNGTSIFNWGDGQSYGNNVWYNLAPVAEQFDVDICGGHAANGEYHHHFYTSCLANLLGDDGTNHSPLYGYMADGYPIYGPYESSGTLAVSGYEVRDYGASPSEGGCNTPQQRTCTLNSATDLSQGVNTNVTAGPDIGATVQTLSGNSLEAVAGYYFEDYYYSNKAAVGVQLDQHNGHNNNDGRGYHYHITLVKNASDALVPAFPYTAGPNFYGTIPDNSFGSCSTSGGMPPRPNR